MLLVSLNALVLGAAEQTDRYRELKQEPRIATDNLYFSWLGCHSCLMIEQKVNLEDFEKLPLIARPDWRAAAKIQIAMQMLMVKNEIVDSFKQAILDQKVDVKDLNSMASTLVALGVEQESLTEVLESKVLFKNIQQAENKAAEYRIQYVPTVIVKGHYATDANSTGSVAVFAETLAELRRK